MSAPRPLRSSRSRPPQADLLERLRADASGRSRRQKFASDASADAASPTMNMMAEPLAPLDYQIMETT